MTNHDSYIGKSKTVVGDDSIFTLRYAAGQVFESGDHEKTANAFRNPIPPAADALQAVIDAIETECNACEACDFNQSAGIKDALNFCFTAVDPGPDGLGIAIQFTKSDRGEGAAPGVALDGQTVQIDLNSREGSETNADSLLRAVRASEASSLVSVASPVGDNLSDIASPMINYSPFVLGFSGITAVHRSHMYYGLTDASKIKVEFKIDGVLEPGGPF